MKKNINFSKFKKIILVILCSITLFFSMPVKSKADFWESLVDVVLKLPDAVMRILNNQISGQPVTKFKINLNLKGWDDETRGSIYNFDVTPYDIFTSGLEAEYTDRDGNVTGTYTKIPLLDINFFDKDNENVPKDSANILRPVIANIYKSLRNLVLVLMMVILLYVGIRIIVSTAVTDQVKYKQWLMDWVVGICLLLLMQYIMSFLMNVNEIVLEMLGDNKEVSYYISLSKLGGGIDLSENSWGSVSDKATKGNSDYEASYEYFFNKHLDIANSNGGGDINSNGNYNFDGNTGTINVDSRSDWGENGNVFINARIFRFATENNTAIIWGTGIVTGLLTMNPFYGAAAAWGVSATLEDDDAAWADKTVYRCNLMEYIRTITTFGSKYVYIYTGSGSYSTFTNSEEVDKGDSVFMGYAILYLLLVIETCMFLYTYIKRVFKLAFYTMIAPLIAFMYPIDKLGDGKAQAFNTWFKEYLFNVLIQPLHLLLYTVFIYAAMELMQESIIYAIGAYAYMIAAEKFFKKIFGFDKAPGGAPGLAGPAMSHALGHGLGKLAGFGPPGKGGGKPKDNRSGDSGKVKFARNPLSHNIGNSNTQSQNGGAPIPHSNGGGAPIPYSNGGGNNTVEPSANGRFGRIINTARRGGGIIKGAASSWGDRTARRLSGAKVGTMKELMTGKGLGYTALNAGKFAGRNAFRFARGVGGTVIGAAGGLVSGALASALTGEDQVSKSMAAGVIAGASRGVQFSDYLRGEGKEMIEEGKDRLAQEDPEYAAHLQAQRMMNENSNITGAQRDYIEQTILNGATAEEIQANLDELPGLMNDDVDPERAAHMFHYNKVDLKDAKKYEEAQKSEAKAILRDPTQKAQLENSIKQEDIDREWREQEEVWNDKIDKAEMRKKEETDPSNIAKLDKRIEGYKQRIKDITKDQVVNSILAKKAMKEAGRRLDEYSF